MDFFSFLGEFNKHKINLQSRKLIFFSLFFILILDQIENILPGIFSFNMIFEFVLKICLLLKHYNIYNIIYHFNKIYEHILES